MSIVVLAVLAPVSKVEQKPMKPTIRYKAESKVKSNGVVYTPKAMANALAHDMLSAYPVVLPKQISILDPAIGHAELPLELVALIHTKSPSSRIKIVGYDIDQKACEYSRVTLQKAFPFADVDIRCEDFLSAYNTRNEKFDFVIANPPYVRTQILGAYKAQDVAAKTGLKGRVDIYYAFLIFTKQVLSLDGVAGYITSNKFLSIKSGTEVRRFMMENYHLYSIVDYGDTKVFENAAVLPCTIVFGRGRTEECGSVSFTTIYETEKNPMSEKHSSVFDCRHESGFFQTAGGRVIESQIGTLKESNPGDIWTKTCSETADWLKKVNQNTWMRLSDLGKIKVGIKTTADNVFIGDNWGEHPLELLRPLLTHRDAGQITAGSNCNWRVLYPHTVVNGKRCAIDIERFPHSKRYLERHREQLEGRRYIHEAGRKWYEIWVPQNPESWGHRKIVFRDISEKPQFWFDNTGAIVNGDCYWIDIPVTVPDEMVYLALAITNSKFIEKYYDVCFNTKLYSGKRRFMTQYVEQFPLPTTNSIPSKRAISIIRTIIRDDRQATELEIDEINELVNEMFEGD